MLPVSERFNEKYVILFLVAISFAARLLGAGSYSLWFDEALNFRMLSFKDSTESVRSVGDQKLQQRKPARHFPNSYANGKRAVIHLALMLSPKKNRRKSEKGTTRDDSNFWL